GTAREVPADGRDGGAVSREYRDLLAAIEAPDARGAVIGGRGEPVAVACHGEIRDLDRVGVPDRAEIAPAYGVLRMPRWADRPCPTWVECIAQLDRMPDCEREPPVWRQHHRRKAGRKSAPQGIDRPVDLELGERLSAERPHDRLAMRGERDHAPARLVKQ